MNQNILPVSIALLGSIATALAQAPCSGNPPATTIATQEFAASFYGGASTPSAAYTGMAEYTDIVVGASITITAMTKTTYDQGVGNPVVPNQVGNTTLVNIYTCPASWLGNQLISPTATGTPWTLAGTGTLTVVAWPNPSPIVLTSPITLPAGSYGLCLETTPTTTGTNPGPLHCIYSTSQNVAQDQFVTLQNQAVQNEAFITGHFVGNINMTMDYTPATNAGFYTRFGAGCYEQPRTFFENFPNGSPIDIQNSGITLQPLGPDNYLVFSQPIAVVPPTSASITLNPPASSSSASWDDGLQPFQLPAWFNGNTGVFPFAGGSTNTITVSSNGFVYLDNVSLATFEACGASYGSLAVLRDNAPRIAAYYHDLDPTVGGGLHWEEDQANGVVRITWNQVQEWGVASSVNTMQITLYGFGQVDIAYGTLANTSATNNAIAGFCAGNGATLPASIDLTAAMPFQSGDGRFPPVLAMDARPVQGTSMNFVTSNITPGTSFVLMGLGLSEVPGGLSLAQFGAPGCTLWINPVGINFFAAVTNGQATVPLTLPPNQFVGTTVFAQSFPLTPGFNAANGVSSNGLCAKVGQQ